MRNNNIRLNIIMTFILSLSLLMGCKEGINIGEDTILSKEPHELWVGDNRELTFDRAGGSQDIWIGGNPWDTPYELSGVPDWLEITKNEMYITLSAKEFNSTDISREATLSITSPYLKGSADFKVTQYGIKLSSCSEVLSGTDGKVYFVKGICTAISNTHYGNLYIDDGTGELYVYGTVDEQGDYCFPSLGIEIGDELLIQGERDTYGSTVELKDVRVLEIDKIGFSIQSILPSEGVNTLDSGDFVIELLGQCENMNVEIPEDAKSWLSIASLEKTNQKATVRLHADKCPNCVGRGTNVVFRSGDSKRYLETTLVQEADEGIDLGLPSGNIWASMNCYKFGFSSIQGYYNNHSSLDTNFYGPSNFKWGGTNEQEYSSSISDISGTDNDQVYLYLGGNWVMPSKNDYQELMDNCQYEWVDNYVDKFSGIVFTGKNGAQIFIPAAHHYTSDNTPCGVYWTSTPFDVENAYSFQFDNNRFYEGGVFRSYEKTQGCNIRPIKRGTK